MANDNHKTYEELLKTCTLRWSDKGWTNEDYEFFDKELTNKFLNHLDEVSDLETEYAINSWEYEVVEYTDQDNGGVYQDMVFEIGGRHFLTNQYHNEFYGCEGIYANWVEVEEKQITITKWVPKGGD